MAKEKMPNDEEARIIRENQMDPGEYAVIHRTETEIRLLCYKTGCYIVIERGYKSW